MQNLNLIQDSDLSLSNVDQDTGEIIQHEHMNPDVIQHTNESIIKRLIPLHSHIADLNLDIKAVIQDAKDADLDAAALNKIAKAFANEKVQKLVQETVELLDLIQSLDSGSKTE